VVLPAGVAQNHLLCWRMPPGGMFFTLTFLPLGVKEGILWKRGRDSGQFQPRMFLLSEREGCLKYFTKQDVSMVVNSGLWGYGDSSISLSQARDGNTS